MNKKEDGGLPMSRLTNLYHTLYKFHCIPKVPISAKTKNKYHIWNK